MVARRTASTPKFACITSNSCTFNKPQQSMESMHQIRLVPSYQAKKKTICEIHAIYNFDIVDPVLFKKVKLNYEVFFR